MKNNYPIKYALMPIEEQTGWIHGLNELEPDRNVIAYIASKCYKISDKTEYYQTGIEKKSYEVVFPYEREDYGVWVRVEPSFNLMHGSCINCITVDKVFDSYEDAHQEACKKNHKLALKSYGYLPCDFNFSECIRQFKEEYEEKLTIYQDLEQKIEQNTKDLVVAENKKEQNIIIVNNGKVMNNTCSLYEFIKLFSYESFCVYNTSIEEYNAMKSEIKNNGKLDDFSTIRDNNCLLVNDKEKNIVQIINYGDKDEIGCFYLKDDNMYYDRNMIPFTKEVAFNYYKSNIIVYTIETYEDVINSHIVNFVIKDDLDNINSGKNVLSKRIKMRYGKNE